MSSSYKGKQRLRSSTRFRTALDRNCALFNGFFTVSAYLLVFLSDWEVYGSSGCRLAKCLRTAVLVERRSDVSW